MAYRRTICTRATLFARRYNPSFAYISHDHDDSNKRFEQPGCRKIDDFVTQRRSFGTSMRNFSVPGNVFHSKRVVLGGIGMSGIGNEVDVHRYMSTSSIGEGVDKVEFLSDMAGTVADGSVEVIASQAPVLSEVAVAAAESAIPVAVLQYVIDGVHSFTGLNWAASIVLTTLLIRGATVPLLINQLKATSKLTMMKPRLDEIKEEIQAKGSGPTATLEGKEKMDALFYEYGVTPFTPLKGLVIQGPIFISFFFAISNMAEKVPSFKNGGAFWFTDLTTPDTMYIFPVLTALSFLITVELNMQEGLEGNPLAGTMKKFSRGLAVLTVPFTMHFPKAIFCYWVTSNIFSFAYGYVLKMPGVKEALGVPKIVVAPPIKNQGAQSLFSLFEAHSKNQGTQSEVSLFKALKQVAALLIKKNKAAALRSSPAIPATSEQPKPAIGAKTSSSSAHSAVLSQRIKSLERQLKQSKKNKRR